MVGVDHIGRTVKVHAADTFYEFIHGWELTLDGFEQGFAKVSKASEEFEGTGLEFFIPPDQLEAIE